MCSRTNLLYWLAGRFWPGVASYTSFPGPALRRQCLRMRLLSERRAPAGDTFSHRAQAGDTFSQMNRLATPLDQINRLVTHFAINLMVGARGIFEKEPVGACGAWRQR